LVGVILGDDKPQISVLIPSLNSQEYIGQCIESVVNQTLDDIEILCIDAGSDDKTRDILESFSNKDSRIRIFDSDKRSYGHQMNIGLDNAEGEYVAIVESDDFIEKNMLSELYGLAGEYDADIVKSTFYHFYDYSDAEVKREVDDSKKDIKSTAEFTINQEPLFIAGHPSIWAAIYENDFLKENGIRFIEEDGGGWVDNPFFYETAFAAKRIVYRHVPYYNYRQSNPDSSSNSLSDFTIPIRRMMDNLDIVEKHDCKDELVLTRVYARAFAYIYNILRRENHEEHMDELRPMIQEMLLRFDESIVLKHLWRKHIDNYYKFLSPIPMIDDEGSDVVISQDDLALIRKEREYLYSEIERYKTERKDLRNKNKALKKEIKSNSSKDNKSESRFQKLFKR
jgi:glycosyltransferase involved in cell wall biosynthesis